MSYSLKKQIIANTAFIAVFSLIFFIYCIAASSLFKHVNSQKPSTAASENAEKKVIVLDPGHGGEDGGTVGVNGVYEKDLNLAVSETLASVLRFAGYEVIETRTEDVLLYDRSVDFKGRKKVLDLAARLEIAQTAMPDIFVGIHMNAFPQEKYSGLTVYYSKNHPSGYDAAIGLQSAVKAALQPENSREIKAAGSNIYLLDRLECPAVLIECGFLSNPEECEKLSTAEYRQQLSYVFFSSLVAFLEE